MAKTKTMDISELPREIAGYSPWETAVDSWFDEAAAIRALEFFPKFLRHIKGEVAGKPFDLELWQQAIIAHLYGWKRQDGSRRYRTCYCEVPRKNGKTTVAAGVALLQLFCDDEAGAEVYSAASSADQAALCFDVARCMVESSPALMKRAKINNSIADRSIRVPSTNSIYKVIPANAARSHGFSPSGIIFDELHTQPNRDVWDVLRTGTGYRRQPLTLALTTAGHDKESICYEIHSWAEKVRDRSVVDEAFFPVIYAAGENDDWRQESTWRKANPNYGISIRPDYMLAECEKAKVLPAAENAFKNLHLNIWTETESRWISSEAWKRCRLPREEWPDLRRAKTWGGLDLGSVDDLTAFVTVSFFEGKWYVKRRSWVPSEAVYRGRKTYQSRYRHWASAGQIEVIEGKAQHYEPVRNAIREVQRTGRLVQVGFDPHNAMDTATILEREGVEMVKVYQGHSGMSLGTKRTEEAILNETLVHDGDEVLEWMIACTQVEMDNNGNTKPNKRASQGADGTRGKIDAVAALVMAMGLASVEPARQACGPLFLV